jgi:hypothetical protein
MIAPLFRDQLEFLVCDPQFCTPLLLRSSAETLLAELKKENLSTSMTAEQFCKCANPAVTLESVTSPSSAQLIRELSKGWARALKSLGPKHGLWFQDVILQETKNIYSRFVDQTKGPESFLKMQMKAQDLMKRTQQLQFLSQEERVFIIKMAFITGSIYNASSIKKGCRGKPANDLICLSAAEIDAARKYMGSEYNAFNQSAHGSPSDTSAMGQKVKRLIDLISKLEPARTMSFRGTGASPALLQTPLGQSYIEPIFMSSSLDSKIAQRFLGGGAQILLTKNCPLVSGSGALFEGEFEILCKPRTALKMISREYRGGNVYFFMEE